MPSAVESNQTQFKGILWRAVEAQHLVSTMRLVDNKLDDQMLLEQLIETAKPPLPPGTEGLHWLLAAPFRYLPTHSGSRFRGLHDPGVFYGARTAQTACAECGYWRWRFVRDSAGFYQPNQRSELRSPAGEEIRCLVGVDIADLGG